MNTDFLYITFLGNPVIAYLKAAAWFIAGFTVLWLVKRLLVVRLHRLSQSTETNLDDFIASAIERTVVPALYVGVFYLAMHSLSLQPAAHRATVMLSKAALTFFAIGFLVDMVRFLLLESWIRRHPSQQELAPRILGLMPILTIFIWVLGVIFLLDNLGFKISTMVAGLGIGGVAVALGAQAVLGDLFAYFAILLDRPFVIGDVIHVGDFIGIVERIGIKTTRLRSLSGEQVVFANKDLTDSRLRNYKRMTDRRVVFTFGVSYETPNEKLREIPGLVKDIITAIPQTRFDRAHFRSFEASQLTFEVVYFVVTADFNLFMDIQQQVNLTLKEALEQRGIEIPYNTQTVYLRQAPPA
jgi:small-conductance mechanosensitive channel